MVMRPRDGFNYFISGSLIRVMGHKIGQFLTLKLTKALVIYLRKVP